MADERDARLILRAEDRATKTFEQVGRSVQALRKDLVDQAKAAAAGEGSIDALLATLTEYKEVAKDIGTQQSAAKGFDSASAAAAKAQGRFDQAKIALDEYQKKFADGKGSEKGLNSKQNAFDNATAGLDKANTRLAGAQTKIEAVGLAGVEAAQRIGLLDAQLKDVAQGTVEAARNVVTLTEAQKEAAIQAAATSAAEAELSRTTEREAAVAGKAARQRTADLLASSTEILKGNKAVELSFEELNAEIATGVRGTQIAQVARDATEAATNLNRFAQTSDAATFGITRLGEAIRGIVAPALAEVQSLDGALKQVEESADLASSGQKRRVSQYQDSLNALSQAQAALVRQANNIDAFTRQTAAVDKLDAELAQAALKVQSLAAAFMKSGTPELERELAQASRELETVGGRAQDARKKFVDMADALKRAGINTDDLTADLARLEAGARKSATAATTLTTKVGGNGKGFLGLKPYELQNLSFQINDVFTSLASGISPAQTAAQQGGQIFQILQTQIGALLTRIVPLLPVLAPLAAGIALVAYQLYEVKKSSDATKGFADFFALSGNAAGLSAQQFGQAQLALEKLKVSADDAKTILRAFVTDGLNPAGLDTYIKTVETLAKATGETIPAAAQEYSAALTGGFDAVVALNDKTGVLNDTQLDEIQRLFDAGKAQEARTAVAAAYEARADAIANKSKTEWSNATDELHKAYERLSQSFGTSDVAGQIASIAIKNLTEDVRVFTKIVDIARGGFQALLFARASLAAQGTTARGIATLGYGGPTNYQAELAKQLQANGLNPDGSFITTAKAKANASPVGTSTRTSGGSAFLRTQETQLKNAKLLTSEQRLQVAETDAANAAAKAGASDVEAAQARVNARKIEQAKLDKEAATQSKAAGAAARSAESKAEAAARAAEARQSKIDSLTKDLENTYASLGANKSDDPFKAIQIKATNAVRDIQKKFADLGKLGVTTVGGKSQADFLAAVKASADLETSQARQKQNEEDVNKLLDQRKTRLASIEDQIKDGSLTPLAGIDASKAVLDDLNPKIIAAAKAARDYQESLSAGKPDPKAEAFLAKMESVLRETNTNGTLKVDANVALKATQDSLDALVNRRDEVVKLQTALENAGLKTPGEAQKAIKDAFDNSRPAILAAADAVQKIVDKMVALGLISPEAAAQLTGALDLTRAGAKRLDADITSLKNSALQALSGALNDFILSIGDNIGAALDGTQSLGETLAGLGQAALSFAATFTRAIAQAIVQLVALKIAKAALGAIGISGFHEGGVIGSSAPTFTRRVSPLAFAGAVRYHTGGLVGLRPDETPAILQKGEEVITAADPRHRNNGGRSGTAAPVNIKNINLFDAGEAVSQGANTRDGEQAILNVVQRNKAALGIGG